MSRNTATATVKATEVGMQWEQGNMKQGMLWEDYVGNLFPLMPVYQRTLRPLITMMVLPKLLPV